MIRLVEFFGYKKNIDIRIKYTYLIAAVSILLLLGFLPLYIFIVNNALVVLAALISMFLFFCVFIVLKFKLYYIGKFMTLAIFLGQNTLLVFYFFPRESLFYFFYFIIAPITFIVFDLEKIIDRILIILFNTILISTLALSVILPDTSIIDLDYSTIQLFELLSILSTSTSIIGVFFLYARTLSKQTKELNILASTDYLTNISNRRILFEKGEELFQISQKYNRHFMLMLIDLDHFKKINDLYGHPIGDKVLIQLTQVIRNSIRKQDLFCRYGGEEFAIIIRDPKDEDILALGDKLRIKINSYSFRIPPKDPIHITISGGIVAFDSKEFEHFDQMVVAADQSLYIAKKNGRNQVVLYKS